MRPLELLASSVGFGVARFLHRRGARFEVAGAYRSAVNLRYLQGEHIIGLVHAGKGNAPNAILVDHVAFDELGLLQGMVVEVEDGSLFCTDCGLTVSVAHSPVWRPGHPARLKPVPQLWAHLDAAYDVLAGGPRHGLGALGSLRTSIIEGRARRVPETDCTPVARTALGPLRRLVQGMRSLSPPTVIEASRGLAGLGPGLTPSGDDVLGGFALAVYLTTRVDRDLHVRVRRILRQAVLGAAERTTALSRTFLRWAVRGSGPERLHDAISALLEADERRVVDSATRLRALGGTSGEDLLLGAVLGVETALNMLGYARTTCATGAIG